MVLKFFEKVHFLQFCVDLIKKFKPIKAIYIYPSEKSRLALSENGINYYPRILLNFCQASISFDILITNISRTVAQNSINHSLFWKSVMRTFRCIYVNWFNRIRFLAEVSTKLQVIQLFRQFKDHRNGKWKLGKWPHFFHLFFRSNYL